MTELKPTVYTCILTEIHKYCFIMNFYQISCRNSRMNEMHKLCVLGLVALWCLAEGHRQGD